MTAEEFYIKERCPEFDKHDKNVPKFDYYSLLDFAEEYHKHEIKQ